YSTFYALLVYLWVAYFRPESWVWSIQFIASLNLSLITGAYLLLRAPFSDAKFRVDTRVALLFLLLMLDVVSTLNSNFVNTNLVFFQDFVKSIVITYLLSSIVTTTARLRMVLLVIAFSLGFENAKQGWVTFI